jgi:hypothetical protein
MATIFLARCDPMPFVPQCADRSRLGIEDDEWPRYITFPGLVGIFTFIRLERTDWGVPVWADYISYAGMLVRVLNDGVEP